MLPFCSWCKKIRDDSGYWHQLESYIASHTKAVVTHGICPECAKIVLKDSILFTDHVDPFFGLNEWKQVRIANPLNDNFKDFNPLIEFHIQKGHAVYASFHPANWSMIEKGGLLNDYEIKWLRTYKNSILSRIVPKTS